MIPAAIGFPIPVPEGTPEWLVNALFIAGGVAVFLVLLWQAVRYFRNNRGDSGDSGDE